MLFLSLSLVFLFEHPSALIVLLLLSAFLIGKAVLVIMNKLPITESLKRRKYLFANIIGIGGSVFIVLGGAFLGLTLISENNRERIALETLYPDNASTSEGHMREHPFPALTGALNSRFPSGTNIENLKNYVTKLKGKCYQSQLGQPIVCSIVEFGTICISNTLSITAETNKLNQIEHINAVRIFDAC